MASAIGLLTSRRVLARPARIGAFLVALALVAAACNPSPPSRDYVALGDSYVSGPLIPTQLDVICGNSTRNYPTRVSQSLATTAFDDMSCNGAEIPDLMVGSALRDPQIDALAADTGLVTIGIGGNDIDFINIVLNCVTIWPWDPGCEGDYVSGSNDQLSNDIWATQAPLEALIAEVTTRSPQAVVLVVGYPSLLPMDPNVCDALIPITNSDINYLRAKNEELNAMIEASAVAQGVTYVDAYTSSIGHDLCRNDSTKWVEALVPTDAAAPVHPNADGMANTAIQVALAAAAAGF